MSLIAFYVRLLNKYIFMAKDKKERDFTTPGFMNKNLYIHVNNNRKTK